MCRLLIFCLVTSFFACFSDSATGKSSKAEVASIFEVGKDQGILANKAITEASGLASSHSNPHHLWTLNDHGDKNRLFLLDDQGRDQGVFYLAGADNRDWEDLAIAKTGGVAYLYVADIGDNDQKHEVKNIYRVREPLASESNRTLQQVETIRITYPEGTRRNAEAFLVDQQNQDFYIFTKEKDKSNVYRLPYPQSSQTVNQAEWVLTLPLNTLTGASISPDNQEIVLKNYESIYYWKRQPGENIGAALRREATVLPYTREPHGEAIAFAADNSGYFTVSEIKHDFAPHLYFYRRK